MKGGARLGVSVQQIMHSSMKESVSVGVIVTVTVSVSVSAIDHAF